MVMNRDLRTPVLAALRTTLQFAEGLVLGGDRPFDAEIDGEPADLPADYAKALLLRLAQGSADQQVVPSTTPPHRAERKTFGVLERALWASFPGCSVVGDKATLDEMATADQAEQDALIFSVDAIDGSLPYEVLTFGYGVSLVALQRVERGLHLRMTAIGNSSHFAAVFESPNSIWLGSLASQERQRRNRFDGEPAVYDAPVERTVAVLAAQPHYRARLRSLFASDSFTIYTTGGNPAALGMLLGSLDALVSVEAQTIYDAAYLPILAAAGVPIRTDAGQYLTSHEVAGLFETVGDWNAKPIPPFIAARTPQTMGELAPLVF